MAGCTVACVQTNSGREIGPNIDAVLPLIGKARERGADLVLLPENVAMIEPIQAKQQEKALPEAEHPALAAFADAASNLGVWLLIGSLAIRRDDERVANRSLLVDAAGRVVARYDKIHLFDVDLGPAESYRESAVIAPGDRIVVAKTPWGGLGLSVCYDLRFPHLYRALAKAGADFLAIPAAFTRTTGAAHWHVLARARAIETGCYVLAPAQCGTHAEGRLTFGHSLIVDPWGVVVADAGEDVGTITAEIDAARVTEARRRVPALEHDRPFAAPPP
ncbi:MAG TPA: carbon-nitrogen hydrolase family protein [Rhodospirillales bacterium]|nr:carbon-nitrogen hydrolase family protein [Rhodospirillales bacterium]